jgi:SAM-dependent methyltransferase
MPLAESHPGAGAYFDRHAKPGYWGDITRHFDQEVPLLDLGCGTGWLGDHFPRYTGIELSPSAVNEARSQGRNVLLGDVGDVLPFADSTFGQIVCKDVLEHVEHPTRVVAELFRISAPAGRIYACSPDNQRWAWEDYSHRRPYPLSALGQMFSDAGFVVTRAGYETVVPGSAILSGRTRDHRRPALLRAVGHVPFLRRNSWVLVERPAQI